MIDNYANGYAAQNAALNRKILRAQKQKVPYYNPDYDNLPREPQSLSQVRAKIKEFQKSLNALGANIRVDGIIGPETKQAYAKYHIQMIPSSETGKNLFPTINYKQITENPFSWQSMMDRTKSQFTELHTKKSSIAQTTNKESQNQTEKSEQSSLWDRILSGITNDAKVEQKREKTFYRIERIKPPSQMSLSEKFDYFKRTGDWENLKKLYRAHPELIRAYDSQQEIVNHKKKHNVRDPYVIIDKEHGNEYITDSEGNPVKYKVATGQHKQDEFKVFPKNKTPVDKEWYSRQTASGIFKAQYVSDYKYAGLPGYFIMDDITNSPYNTIYAHQALHGIPIHMKPNTPYKDKLKSEGYRKGLSAIKRGETITAGCIRNTDEAMQNLYSTLDSTNSRRDTVYVLPNNPNAGIIESGHQLVYLHPDQTKPATKDGRKLVYVQRPKIKKKKPTTWDKIKYWLGSH